MMSEKYGDFLASELAALKVAFIGHIIVMNMQLKHHAKYMANYLSDELRDAEKMAINSQYERALRDLVERCRAIAEADRIVEDGLEDDEEP